jgi:hypothetical protein
MILGLVRPTSGTALARAFAEVDSLKPVIAG